MRIAVFHELHEGGARRAVNELGVRLKRKHVVDLYYVSSQKNKKDNKFFNKVYFYEFQEIKWKRNNWSLRLYKDTLELLKLAFLHRKISKEIDKKRYDFVFVHPSSYTQSPFLLSFLKTKTIYYCQESLRMVYEKIPEFEIKSKGIKRIYDMLNRKIRKVIDKQNMKHANIIFANSKFTKKNIFKNYKINSHVCYLGVDVNFFNYKKVNKDIDVLFIGSFLNIDGYSTLEKSLEYLPTLHIQVVNWASRYISDVLLRDYYRRAKIVVGLSYNEPFGLVPLEAMACGTPIIAINEGGYKETVIDSKTGYLIKRDSKIVAEKVRLLLSDQKLHDTMSENAREYVRKSWNWDLQVEKLEKQISKFSI